jgi:hypothetical protein
MLAAKSGLVVIASDSRIGVREFHVAKETPVFPVN